MPLGVNYPSNRNKYQEYFLEYKSGQCVGLTTLAPSCANSLHSMEELTRSSPYGLSRPVMRQLYLSCTKTDLQTVMRWFGGLVTE